MDEAHRPIVELALTSLGDGGSIFDLGCGNGALLKKICDGRPNVIPFGIDMQASKIEHARQLQPAFVENFVAGNMFEGIPLDADTVYSLVLLMPGRLLEVDEIVGPSAEGMAARPLPASARVRVRRVAHASQRTRRSGGKSRTHARVSARERSRRTGGHCGLIRPEHSEASLREQAGRGGNGWRTIDSTMRPTRLPLKRHSPTSARKSSRGVRCCGRGGWYRS